MICYLDHAATTPLDPRVLEAMMPYLTDKFQNPSSSYAWEVSSAIGKAREAVAALVGCDAPGVIFTSGGTEADNLAIKGTAYHYYAQHHRPAPIITSNIEHKAVMNTCDWLERMGFASVTYVPADEDGIINYMDVRRALNDTPEVSLVSIMGVNNELGIIQPYELIGMNCHSRETPVLFHTDAVQLMHVERVNMRSDIIDMLSMSAHKFNGPKGIGALCLSKAAAGALTPILHGGLQEYGVRPGTENVAGIIGMGKAAELLRNEWDERQETLKMLDRCMADLLRRVPGIRMNNLDAPEGYRAPGYFSIAFKEIDAETILLMLNNRGICVSSGSACNSGSVETSHVLRAVGVPAEYIDGTIRITLGHENKMYEIIEFCRALCEVVASIDAQRGRGEEST